MSQGRGLASVVVNNHNYERFLPEAIDSALAQTYQAVEVVVVDDGSTDASRRVIARYGNRIIPVLKANGGQGSALNAGFAASRGDIVLFLDADDVLLPNAVAKAAERLADPSIVKVHWPLWEIDAQGNKTGGMQPVGSLPEGDLREIIIREGPTACTTPPTSANAWSRRFLEQVLPMPEPEFRINSDGYLVTLGWIYGKARTVTEPQGLYRIHGKNNFVTKPAGERQQRMLEMFLHRCDALAHHLGLLGVQADAEVWKLRHALYHWPERVSVAKQAIATLVPVGGRFILVDDQTWADESGGGGLVDGRHAIPFLERDGVYWGLPENEAEAIWEVERLRAAGAGHIVFAWPAFWWLEKYCELDAYLRAAFPCLLSTDELIVFDLRPLSSRGAKIA